MKLPFTCPPRALGRSEPLDREVPSYDCGVDARQDQRVGAADQAFARTPVEAEGLPPRFKDLNWARLTAEDALPELVSRVKELHRRAQT